MSLTDKDITDALALCEAATPGAWRVGDAMKSVGVTIWKPGAEQKIQGAVGHWARVARNVSPADASFIAAARTGWPAALAELKRLRDEIEPLRKSRGEATSLALSMRDVARDELEKGREAHAAHAAELTAERDAARAEAEMLRGVGCNEDGDGPCGACIKCARTERDAAIARAEKAEGTIANMKAGREEWEDASRSATARDTAEAIAAWLEKNAPYPPASTADKAIRDMALTIRHGAWRKDGAK